jgi:hypothetical protein
MDHPDFASPERSFATLGYPEDGWGMVKLTPIEQGMFRGAHRAVFESCAGAWGRRGATRIRLKAARKHTVRRALLAAWLRAAPKALSRNIARRPGTLGPHASFSHCAQRPLASSTRLISPAGDPRVSLEVAA